MSQLQRKEKIASRLRARVASNFIDKDLCPSCGKDRAYVELLCSHSICVECFAKLVEEKTRLVCPSCLKKELKAKPDAFMKDVIKFQNKFDILAVPETINPHDIEIKRIYGDLKFYSYVLNRIIPFGGKYETGCNLFVVLEKDVDLSRSDINDMLSEIIESGKTMEGSFLERLCKGKIVSKEYVMKNDKVGFTGPGQALVVYKVSKRN